MSKELIRSLREMPLPYVHQNRFGGFEFTNWQDEQMSWHETCYIGDWSFLTNLIVEGPDALNLFADASINSYAKFDIGQCKHLIFCNGDGKVVAEGIIQRLGQQKFAVQAPAPALYTEYKLATGHYNATCHEERNTNFQVSGPNALYVLEKLTDDDLRQCKVMHFVRTHMCGHEVLAMRMGMASEIGFELQAPLEHHEEILDAVLGAGREFGIRRIGRRTVNINHLEACYPTGNWHYLIAIHGPDMAEYREFRNRKNYTGSLGVLVGSFEGDDISDYYRSPVECGWTKRIGFDHEFIGRSALEAEVANPKRTIVTLVFNSEDMIDVYASLFREGEPYKFMDMPLQQHYFHHADQVLKEGKPAGVSTVPGYSFYFRKILSLTYINVEHSKPGTEVNIVWGEPGTRQKLIRATVAPAPYKKDNRWVDLTTLPSYKGRTI
jgi:vanillate/3-O-methylgallate O-demethylase